LNEEFVEMNNNGGCDVDESDHCSTGFDSRNVEDEDIDKQQEAPEDGSDLEVSALSRLGSLSDTQVTFRPSDIEDSINIF